MGSGGAATSSQGTGAAGSLTTSAGTESAGTESAGATTSPQETTSGGETSSGGDTPFDPGPEPLEPIQPLAGEITIIQLDLPATLHGESAIIIGPSGEITLLDVGGSFHEDSVRDRIRDLNTNWITPERGFPASRAPLQVEWMLLTHLHADHVGAFRDILGDSDEPLAMVHGVVHRGFVDIGEGVNADDYGDMCTALRGEHIQLNVELCAPAEAAPCDYDDLMQSHPAVNCDGLRTGNLAVSDDDANGEAAYIDLGGGARITLVGVNGFFNDGDALESMTFGVDTGDEENARSLVGIISHGDWRYHFGGDLHGRPDDGPDVESHLIETSAASFYGDLGVDVVHAHHHARRTSSNPTFVGAMAPMDGRSRNVVAGANGGHLGSPFAEVLAAWGDGGRLGGGNLWITSVTIGGATSDELVEADGEIIVQTAQGGKGYWIQAAGDALQSKAFESLR